MLKSDNVFYQMLMVRIKKRLKSIIFLLSLFSFFGVNGFDSCKTSFKLSFIGFGIIQAHAADIKSTDSNKSIEIEGIPEEVVLQVKDLVSRGEIESLINWLQRSKLTSIKIWSYQYLLTQAEWNLELQKKLSENFKNLSINEIHFILSKVYLGNSVLHNEKYIFLFKALLNVATDNILHNIQLEILKAAFFSFDSLKFNYPILKQIINSADLEVLEDVLYLLNDFKGSEIEKNIVLEVLTHSKENLDARQNYQVVQLVQKLFPEYISMIDFVKYDKKADFLDIDVLVESLNENKILAFLKNKSIQFDKKINLLTNLLNKHMNITVASSVQNFNIHSIENNMELTRLTEIISNCLNLIEPYSIEVLISRYFTLEKTTSNTASNQWLLQILNLEKNSLVDYTTIFLNKLFKSADEFLVRKEIILKLASLSEGKNLTHLMEIVKLYSDRYSGLDIMLAIKLKIQNFKIETIRKGHWEKYYEILSRTETKKVHEIISNKSKLNSFLQFNTLVNLISYFNYFEDFRTIIFEFIFLRNLEEQEINKTVNDFIQGVNKNILLKKISLAYEQQKLMLPSWVWTTLTKESLINVLNKEKQENIELLLKIFLSTQEMLVLNKENIRTLIDQKYNSQTLINIIEIFKNNSDKLGLHEFIKILSNKMNQMTDYSYLKTAKEMMSIIEGRIEFDMNDVKLAIIAKDFKRIESDFIFIKNISVKIEFIKIIFNQFYYHPEQYIQILNNLIITLTPDETSQIFLSIIKEIKLEKHSVMDELFSLVLKHSGKKKYDFHDYLLNVLKKQKILNQYPKTIKAFTKYSGFYYFSDIIKYAVNNKNLFINEKTILLTLKSQLEKYSTLKGPYVSLRNKFFNTFDSDYLALLSNEVKPVFHPEVKFAGKVIYTNEVEKKLESFNNKCSKIYFKRKF